MRQFNAGDQVKIDEEFEGSVTVAGWKSPEIENFIFEVTTFDDYRKVNPKFAKTVKDKPSTGGEVFLKHESTVFVLSPSHALRIVKKAPPQCRCPIFQLWNGKGHYTSCPEK
jgi:hypothetical protein